MLRVVNLRINKAGRVMRKLIFQLRLKVATMLIRPGADSDWKAKVLIHLA